MKLKKVLDALTFFQFSCCFWVNNSVKNKIVKLYFKESDWQFFPGAGFLCLGVFLLLDFCEIAASGIFSPTSLCIEAHIHHECMFFFVHTCTYVETWTMPEQLFLSRIDNYIICIYIHCEPCFSNLWLVWFHFFCFGALVTVYKDCYQCKTKILRVKKNSLIYMYIY